MERTTNAKPETVTTEPEILTPALRSVLATSGGRIEPDVLYDTMQAAQILGISARSLERWRKDGRGPKITRLFVNAPPRYRGIHLLEAMERSAEG